MKKSIIIAIILLQSLYSYSQEDYMNIITNKACECVAAIPDKEKLTGENFGLCILEEAAQYKDELLRDHNIDMLNIDVDGEELGRIVALKMVSKCPEQIKRIAAASTQKTKEEEESSDVVEGMIKSITKNDFIVFSLRDTDGKTSKFYWLTFIKSNNDIQKEYESFKGKKVKIEYSTIELYDPNLGEYRKYNMIESLNTIN